MTVAQHMHLVRSVVGAFGKKVSCNVTRDDLMSAGCIGLMNALEKNGGDQGPTFEAYARIRIRGAILDDLRKQDFLPRGARAGCNPMSLVRFDDLPPAERDIADPRCEDPREARERAQAVKRAIKRLPPRHRVIIRNHYFRDVSITEISTQMGVTPARVSQLHTRAVGRLARLIEHPRYPRPAPLARAQAYITVLRLPKDLALQLRAVCRDRGWPLHSFITHAVAQRLDNNVMVARPVGVARVCMRFPERMVDSLKKTCVARRCTVSQWVCHMLAERLGKPVRTRKLQRICIRFPKHMAEKLRKTCIAQGCSMSRFVSHMVAEEVAA